MLKIIEALDYGMSLLSNGDVLKADGTIISKFDYEKQQQAKERNKLDWKDIEVDEFINFLDTAIFATKTYDVEETSFGMSQSKVGFALITPEGEPIYLRSSEFSSHTTYQFAESEYGKLIYNVSKNSSEQAFQALSDILENLFGVEDQVGSMFSPDDETTYITKKFIKDNYVWSMVFKNGTLSNIKRGESLHCQMEVRPKQSKLSDMLNNNKFKNMY